VAIAIIGLLIFSDRSPWSGDSVTPSTTLAPTVPDPPDPSVAPSVAWVTDERVNQAEDIEHGAWLTYGRTFEEQRSHR